MMDSQVDPDYQVPMAVLSDSQLSFILDCHSETPIYNFIFIRRPRSARLSRRPRWTRWPRCAWHQSSCYNSTLRATVRATSSSLCATLRAILPFTMHWYFGAFSLPNGSRTCPSSARDVLRWNFFLPTTRKNLFSTFQLIQLDCNIISGYISQCPYPCSSPPCYYPPVSSATCCGGAAGTSCASSCTSPCANPPCYYGSPPAVAAPCGTAQQPCSQGGYKGHVVIG